MWLGKEIHRERLEPVAAHQPQEADDEHQHEVHDDAEDRAADREQDVARGVDDRAHLFRDVDIEVKLLLHAGEPLEKILLICREIGGERRRLADDRLHQEQHHDRDEGEHREVDDKNADRSRKAPHLELVHQRSYPFGEHDRDQHDQDDADDRGQERDQRHDAEHDQRRQRGQPSSLRLLLRDELCVLCRA